MNGTVLHQDNKSAMLLEKNGRASSSRRTRHIDLRYYFVKEHVDSRTIKIVHCPTKEMWGDYFTKPVQGSLFYKLQDAIMNIDPSAEYHSSQRSVLSKEQDVSIDGAHGGKITSLLKEGEEEKASTPHSLL